jgi:hypothetical protein
MTHIKAEAPARALLVGLYSHQYPAIGESHGLSVVAGSLLASMPARDLDMHVLDMVEWGEEGSDRAVEIARRVRANILAIGVSYGTFSVLGREYAAMRAALCGPDPLIILGGPIASYMSGRILRDIAPDAIVILGEADDALPGLVQSWLAARTYQDIPNLHYLDRSTGEEVRTGRRLVNLEAARPPFRDHIVRIKQRGGQIFAETSRACSWAACTFCLRGLTDIAGRSYEFRRKAPRLVADDLNRVFRLGVRDVTLADEDFLGSSPDKADEFIGKLESSRIAFPRLDASLTIHSVYSRKDTPEQAMRREELLCRLKQIGLQKVFLGIESCSPSQLKRYAKGHTREEAAAAVRRLQRLGLRVEIGVILFDPLCTIDEIEDSLKFMRGHGLSALASGLSSELRLQVATHYLALLERYEEKCGSKLHSGRLDPDTLSYPYTFSEASAGRLYQAVGWWNRRLHPLYYPAKSLSRFGSTGSIGEAAYPVRKAVESFRDQECEAILHAIVSMRQGGDPEPELRAFLTDAAISLATALQDMSNALDSAMVQHPVIQRALLAARNVDAVVGPQTYREGSS